jgi:hypothetical protein
VFVYTKRTRAQGADTVPSVKECRLEFTDNAVTLTAESLAAVRLFKQYLRLNAKEKILFFNDSKDITSPQFLALRTKRVRELARQLGCKESDIVPQSSILPLLSAARASVEANTVFLKVQSPETK